VSRYSPNGGLKMAYHEILNAQNKKDWETPIAFVRGIEKTWGLTFTLDAAATAENRKAPRFIDYETNALTSAWGTNETVWINPPYGAWEIAAFIRRALEAIQNGEATTICFLIPNATENTIWQDTIFPNASELCFIGGRISFESGGYPIQGNTKGSVLVFFRSGKAYGEPRLTWIHRDTILLAGH
jgi:phage N-6-adenine-methyltransferase